MGNILSRAFCIAILAPIPVFAAPIVPDATSMVDVNCGSGITSNNGPGERFLECGGAFINVSAETIGFSSTVRPGAVTTGTARSEVSVTGLGQLGSSTAIMEYYLSVDPGTSGATSVNLDIDILHAILLTRTNVSNVAFGGAAEILIGLNDFDTVLYEQSTTANIVRTDFTDVFSYNLGIDDVLAFRATASCTVTNIFGGADGLCIALSDPVFTITDPVIASQASLVFSSNLPPAVIPIPAALPLFLSGITGLILFSRKIKQHS